MSVMVERRELLAVCPASFDGTTTTTSNKERYVNVSFRLTHW